MTRLIPLFGDSRPGGLRRLCSVAATNHLALSKWEKYWRQHLYPYSDRMAAVEWALAAGAILACDVEVDADRERLDFVYYLHFEDDLQALQWTMLFG
jgi:hypothetical protein